jgi:hypothetical protein
MMLVSGQVDQSTANGRRITEIFPSPELDRPIGSRIKNKIKTISRRDEWKVLKEAQYRNALQFSHGSAAQRAAKAVH